MATDKLLQLSLDRRGEKTDKNNDILFCLEQKAAPLPKTQL